MSLSFNGCNPSLVFVLQDKSHVIIRTRDLQDEILRKNISAAVRGMSSETTTRDRMVVVEKGTLRKSHCRPSFVLSQSNRNPIVINESMEAEKPSLRQPGDQWQASYLRDKFAQRSPIEAAATLNVA
ncbi:hypothetical protein J6590_082694 [Homalodisca vitripennis]|nr:hypothetical protein J6590_082694 [Homalodisca vitripennis]